MTHDDMLSAAQQRHLRAESALVAAQRAVTDAELEVRLARQHLEHCKARITDAPPTDDAALGMAWWNGLTRAERLSLFDQADRVRGFYSAELAAASSRADCWALWKSGKIRMDGTPLAAAVAAIVAAA
jgi:hypothetical protein